MPSSARLKKVEKLAAKYDAKLRANDERFNRTVVVVLDDGSVFFYDSSFALVVMEGDTGEWLLVFSEHHAFHVFSRADVVSVRQMASVPIDEMEVK